MPVYMIGYDLHPSEGEKYDDLYTALEAIGSGYWDYRPRRSSHNVERQGDPLARENPLGAPVVPVWTADRSRTGLQELAAMIGARVQETPRRRRSGTDLPRHRRTARRGATQRPEVVKRH
jgi:hypothetical protein